MVMGKVCSRFMSDTWLFWNHHFNHFEYLVIYWFYKNDINNENASNKKMVSILKTYSVMNIIWKI